MTGALDGLRVLDFSRVLAGPYATMLLADLGADVLKVERPEVGDDTRQWGPPYNADGGATYFDAVNRNKRSVALDLSDPDDLAAARRLALEADVLVENFLPGTLARRGLDLDSLRGENPGLIVCSITGFGQQSDLPGYDLLVQAMGGLMSITGEPGQPTKVGVALVDVLTGAHAAYGILAALEHRRRTGEGQWVQTDLLSGLLSGLVNQTSAWLGAGVVPQAAGNAHPSIVPYQDFPTADGRLVVAVGNDRQYAKFAQVVGIEPDERFATNPGRVEYREELVGLIAARLRTRPARDWQRELTAVGVPCGPVNDVRAALEFAESVGGDPVVHIDGYRAVRNPVQMTGTPMCYHSKPPVLDGDSLTWENG